MPLKRQPSETEIDALADQFRALWQPGDVVGLWLRKHQLRLRLLVYDDWSWASVAEALTRAGITYRTGNPWSAEGLRLDVKRASRARKRPPMQGENAAPAGYVTQGSNEPKRKDAGQGAQPAPVLPGDQETGAAGDQAAGQATPGPALPEKRFVFKHSPRLGPPQALTEEERARRDATNERLFGKK